MDPLNNRSGTKLLGALLVQLSQREVLGRMLEDLEDLPREELMEELIAEFEKIVVRRVVEQLVEKELERDRRVPDREKPALAAEKLVPPSENPAPATIAPVMTPSPVHSDLAVPLSVDEGPKAQAPAMKTPKHEPQGKDRHERPKKAVARPEPARERPRTPPKEELTSIERLHPRTGYDLKEEGVFYLHGFTMLPAGDAPSDKPFMLEEKGIEGREFAFALDRGGMRFFVSTLGLYATNVNKHGVLLLNKQESIRLRGIHASILNELRAHGTLMPFAFGTVVVGREDLLRKIDAHTWGMRQAIQEQMKTAWWDLTVYALDSRIAEFLTPEGMSGRRERDRSRESYTVGPAGQKLDIKALEKILGKEKKLAEGIHEELSPIADRADVDMMVGFGSGSSDDWKLILKSSYELPPSRVQWFCRTLTELQYRHFIYELMLVFDGAREPFTFKDS